MIHPCLRLGLLFVKDAGAEFVPGDLPDVANAEGPRIHCHGCPVGEMKPTAHEERYPRVIFVKKAEGGECLLSGFRGKVGKTHDLDGDTCGGKVPDRGL